jgi:hypothetical protein
VTCTFFSCRQEEGEPFQEFYDRYSRARHAFSQLNLTEDQLNAWKLFYRLDQDVQLDLLMSYGTVPDTRAELERQVRELELGWSETVPVTRAELERQVRELETQLKKYVASESAPTAGTSRKRKKISK